MKRESRIVVDMGEDHGRVDEERVGSLYTIRVHPWVRFLARCRDSVAMDACCMSGLRGQDTPSRWLPSERRPKDVR